jgi:hypothetical protein
MSLIIPGNGNASASQRKIYALTAQLDFYTAACAALIVLHGGVVTIPRAALNIDGRIKLTPQADGVRLEVVTPEGVAPVEDKAALRVAFCSACGKQYHAVADILPTCGVCLKPTEWLMPIAVDEGVPPS